MPVIGYNLNIPAANNNPSQDQPKMQTNTNAINTLISLDHFTFADNAAGRHKQVSLANESAPGIPTNTNGVLYANLANGQSWPFWQNALGSTQILGASSVAASGYATLPGGLIIQWGTRAGTHSGGKYQAGDFGTITLPLTFPNAFFTIYGTSGHGGTLPSGISSFSTRILSTSQFQWEFEASTSQITTLNWLALGN